MPFLEEKDGAVILRVHIQPRASRTEMAGLYGDRIKIRLKAPPVEGKANEELIRFLSKLLDVPRRNIEIISGQSGRQKTIKVVGITKESATFGVRP